MRVRLHVTVEEELRRKARARAAELGETLEVLVERAIKREVERG